MSIQQTHKKTSRIPLLLILGGVLILVIALLIIFNQGTPTSGSPRVVADLQEINFGDVKMGEYVQASFQLTNTGTEPLKFMQEPTIEVREGC